ncbi:AmmeMemoRadiSam system protein B [Desulfurispira natronophila]|uniref:MEMO1 family protein HNR37_001345 n=1 Tax=Desulfurispira natronophila TaxID=682562 RepID=A0A7W7Y4Q1_9BACT|nr:AmmeMemoRadiSam system protein B [Desulfurispira natronophila]MBB5022028.1 hypothetical protein [Desulfurispira natronophila]
MTLRHPCVADMFYPGNHEAVRNFLRSVSLDSEKSPARCAVVPHAGWVYSGELAAAVLGCIAIPGKVVMVGPNHTGLGSAIAIFGAGQWRTPLGDAAVAPEAETLAQHLGVQPDVTAHQREHSLEVLVPMLQYFRPDVQILPVATAALQHDAAIAIARAVHESLAGQSYLLVASTDMNHFEARSVSDHKNALAMERIEALDSVGLLSVVEQENISMCGAFATAVAIESARLRGGHSARQVGYTDSAAKNGDTSSVVGYAGYILP